MPVHIVLIVASMIDCSDKTLGASNNIAFRLKTVILLNELFRAYVLAEKSQSKIPLDRLRHYKLDVSCCHLR